MTLRGEAPDGEIGVTRETVDAAVAEGRSWGQAAESLGVSAGLAFMVGTGVPADGSGVPALEERVGPGQLLSSPQELVNPRAHNPLRNELIEAWVRDRAARELG
jgi:hypothetical protein